MRNQKISDVGIWEIYQYFTDLMVQLHRHRRNYKKKGGDGKLKLYLYKKENISTTMFDSAVVNVYIAVIV